MRGGFIEIGRVLGPHGVRGDLRVAVFSGDPSGLVAAPRVLLRAPGGGKPASDREFEVASARPQGRGAVLSLSGIETPEDARGLAGALVLVRREDLPPPGEDEYYWADLVGCRVDGPDGSPIGTVTGVEGGPAHDWLKVDRGGREGFLPMAGPFILSIDTAARRIVASPPPEW